MIASRTTSLLINNRCFLSKDRGKEGEEIFARETERNYI